MSRTLALLAALLLTAAARAQTPEAKPADAPPAEATKPAEPPPAEPAKPADAPPAEAKAPEATTPPPAAAKDAPAAAEEKASCNEEDIEKKIDDAIAAMKASPANGKAKGNFRKAFTQLNAAKKAVKAGCAAYMKPAPKAKGKGKAAPKAK